MQGRPMFDRDGVSSGGGCGDHTATILGEFDGSSGLPLMSESVDPLSSSLASSVLIIILPLPPNPFHFA